MVESPNFYQAMSAIDRLAQITDEDCFQDVPSDWLIAITDVVNSTRAIEVGKYREVNSVAAASIMALLNAAERVSIPFVFGGDGALVLIPPSLRARAEVALLASERMAKRFFNLELRVALVPVQTVYDAGYAVRVAKLRVSENFEQAIITGGGVRYAESLIKDKAQGKHYLLYPHRDDYHADFNGYECRWNEMRAKHDEAVSLIVQATASNTAQANTVYREVLAEMDRLLGDSAARHPITQAAMRLNLLPRKFRDEALVRYGNDDFATLLGLATKTFIGRLFMLFNIKGWGRYKQLFLAATDHEKFDDALRMTVSGTRAQIDSLRAYLESRRAEGVLVYGMHRATATLVTCFIVDHFGQQVHFVDGANGGYALAARELKEQLAARKAGAA